MTNHGLYSTPNFPHKGWAYHSEAEDETGTTLCQACGTQAIRHIHVLAHPAWPDLIETGCVCAGNLTEDSAGAHQRQLMMQNRSIARARKIKLANAFVNNWVHVSSNNFENSYNKKRIMLFKSGAQGWSYRIISGTKTIGEDDFTKPEYAAESVMRALKL